MSEPTGIDAAKAWTRLVDKRKALINASADLFAVATVDHRQTAPLVANIVLAHRELEAAYTAYRAVKDGVTA